MRTHETKPSLIAAIQLKAAEYNLRKTTVQTYISWVRSYYKFTQVAPRDCCEKEVANFLTHMSQTGYAPASASKSSAR